MLVPHVQRLRKREVVDETVEDVLFQKLPVLVLVQSAVYENWPDDGVTANTAPYIYRSTGCCWTTSEGLLEPSNGNCGD